MRSALFLFACVACGNVDRAEGPEDARCGNATTEASSVIEPSARPRPDLGSWHLDPELGGCVSRVSDHASTPELGSLRVSSQRQAWNSDGTRILLDSGHVLDAATYRVVAELPAPAVWAPDDPAALYSITDRSLLRHDVANDESSEVAVFPEYGELDPDAGLGEVSSDGKTIALVGVRKTDDVYEIFTWDLAAQQKSPVLAAPVDFVHRSLQPRWVRISPSGRNVVIAWPDAGTQAFQGIELFDRELARVAQLSPSDGHADIALDAHGNEWLVDEKPGDNGPVIEKTPLTGGQPSELLALEWFHSVRISCRAEQVGVCVLSTQGDPAGSWQPLQNEVFALDLASTSTAPLVARLAHHHSAPEFVSTQPESVCPLSPEAVLSSPSLSRDGDRVLFTSNWNENCFGELYLIQR